MSSGSVCLVCVRSSVCSSSLLVCLVWSVSSVSGLVWSGLVWSGLVFGLVWSGRSGLVSLFWSGLVSSRLVSSGLVGLVWSGLVSSRLVSSRLVSSLLVWSGLVWSVSSRLVSLVCLVWSGLSVSSRLVLLVWSVSSGLVGLVCLVSSRLVRLASVSSRLVSSLSSGLVSLAPCFSPSCPPCPAGLLCLSALLSLLPPCASPPPSALPSLFDCSPWLFQLLLLSVFAGGSLFLRLPPSSLLPLPVCGGPFVNVALIFQIRVWGASHAVCMSQSYFSPLSESSLVIFHSRVLGYCFVPVSSENKLKRNEGSRKLKSLRRKIYWPVLRNFSHTTKQKRLAAAVLLVLQTSYTWYGHWKDPKSSSRGKSSKMNL